MYDLFVYLCCLFLLFDLFVFVLFGIISVLLWCWERVFLDVEGGRGLVGGVM